MLFRPYRVSDRSSHAEEVVGAEIVSIVLDMIVVNLGPDKYMSPNVVSDPGSKMLHEVVAADVKGAATEKVARRRIRRIEPNTLTADAGHEVRANLLAEARLVHTVEVIKDWPVRLSENIGSLTGPPRGFKTEAKAVMKRDDVEAHV